MKKYDKFSVIFFTAAAVFLVLALCFLGFVLISMQSGDPTVTTDDFTVLLGTTSPVTTPFLENTTTTIATDVPTTPGTGGTAPNTGTTSPNTTTAPVTNTPPPDTTTTKVTQTTTSPITTPPVTTTPVTTTPVTTPPRDPNAKVVAFSFDDGPNSSLTRKFVDKLNEYGAKATFFVVGNRMGKNNGAALKYCVDNGMEVGLHSWDHSYYNKMSMDEYLNDLAKTEAAIKKYVNADIRLMRPPGGILSTAQKEACPYTAVKWSVDSNDWKYKSRKDEATIKKNVETIVNNVMKNIKSGDIVLMHELYQNSYDAFCIIIEQLYSQGYEIVTVGELLGDAKIQPGKLYYNGR